MSQINWKSVAISAGIGALTSGASAFANTAIKGTTAFAAIGRTAAQAAVGAVGNATGGAMKQTLVDKKPLDFDRLKRDAAWGATGTMLGEQVGRVAKEFAQYKISQRVAGHFLDKGMEPLGKIGSAVSHRVDRMTAATVEAVEQWTSEVTGEVVGNTEDLNPASTSAN